MLNYTEMYSASLRPFGMTVASFNAQLAEIHLSMIKHWGDMQCEIIRRWTAPLAAARDEQVSNPDAAVPEVNDRAMNDAHQPDEADAGGDAPDEQPSSAAVSVAGKPVAVNAAIAILSNPALASEAATRSSNDAVGDEVRDDVADDIAAEIQREVQQEFESPSARP